MAFKAFDRVVSFAPGSNDAHWVEQELARFAREELAAAQRAGEASRHYTRAVNGQANLPEEAVRAPGPIVYSFGWLAEAAITGLTQLKARSPVRSGRYRRSFIAVADGREVPVEAIGLARKVELVNTQPYSRKIQVGAQGFETRRGLFDAAARALRREFRGLVRVRVVFVRLSNGYRLRRGRSRRGDRGAGGELNYPALELVSESVVVQ